jgi:hypothetical protein
VGAARIFASWSSFSTWMCIASRGVPSLE